VCNVTYHASRLGRQQPAFRTPATALRHCLRVRFAA